MSLVPKEALGINGLSRDSPGVLVGAILATKVVSCNSVGDNGGTGDFGGLYLTVFAGAVDAGAVTGSHSITGDNTVQAEYVGPCLSQKDQAQTGTIVIESADAETVRGSYDVTFADGHLSGTFVAPVCQGLAAALTTGNSMPACEGPG